MNMSSNLLTNTDKRAELLSGYRRFLEQAEANKACIIKYALVLSREQYTDQIQKADHDINFAYRKILELSIPISNRVPAPMMPSLPEIPVLAKMDVVENDITAPEADFSLKWLGVAVAGLIAVPFIAKVAGDNPGATRQLIHQLALLFHSDQV